ncbi:type I glutamate--ammonia ligase [Picrophilus oshimae]|uniref:Glutamine synthetase n=1 Tax=Picrophilus torridus (strain ATCC 700027 / DSM 9790 / JCM 10055 / NBRC 100828 / KAW 2/3) TaxID=1122961 RepID=Q6L1N4_PICTO|nr:type I glutamate--ammonia ligase [Picrophilus oshimae]AAT43118.1 glutamine synthetase [Picrophilus oshimae DSM 9789]SMD30574.1 L-glutamine synthetase [Picrophilus oshimae DSM 9789]
MQEDEGFYLERLKADKIDFLQIQFTDITGHLKSLTVPKNRFEDVLYDGITFDGSSIPGFKPIENSDMKAMPDLSTYTIISQNSLGKTARFISKIFNPDGTRFDGDPRYVLERQIDRLKKENKHFYIGPEIEYFIFKRDDKNRPTVIPSDQGVYFDKNTDSSILLKEEIVKRLEDIDYYPEASHHEVAPGQHEIDVKYADAITMADRLIVIKSIVKDVAAKHGYYATFMPKPIKGINGSGMHVHQSIFNGDNNAFYDENNRYGLSKYALSYIAGILKNIKGASPILAPLVNSYKRLVPGYEAPVYICWANRNRSALVRVPAPSGKAKRIELRFPDSTGNHYLQFAVMLGMGLDGIENKAEIPDPVERNVFEMPLNERAELGIETMPGSLGEAIKEMERSETIKEILGEHIFENYIKLKRMEWEDYTTYVTDWEINRYLEVY